MFIFNTYCNTDLLCSNTSLIGGSCHTCPLRLSQGTLYRPHWAFVWHYNMVGDYVLKSRKPLNDPHSSMYSTKLWPVGDIPCLGIILVEPPMIDRDVFNNHIKERQQQTQFLLKAVSKQRGTWPSREAAHQYFEKRLPWSLWDKRVLQTYVVSTNSFCFLCLTSSDIQKLHGLYRVKEEGEEVATKVDKLEEGKTYVEFEPTFAALNQIAVVCRKIPLHVIFGSVNDLVLAPSHLYHHSVLF